MRRGGDDSGTGAGIRDLDICGICGSGASAWAELLVGRDSRHRIVEDCYGPEHELRMAAMDYRARLKAAIGWYEIGLPAEALAELVPLPWRIQMRRPLLELRLAAEIANGSWNAASDTSRLLCLKEPGEPVFFLQAAHCLHETGDTLAACPWLMRGPKSLLACAVFHYNLACYLAVLGELRRAKSHLATAFSLDGRLRDKAVRCADLAGVLARGK
jgi:predicted Zn-dependent protease